MTENLDPQTATRAALGEEIERLRLQLIERNDAVKFMTRMRDKAERERDEARQEINRLREELRQVLRDAPFAANFRQARKLLDDTLVRAEQAEAQRDEAQREIDQLRALTAECTCGTTYATYEGPEPDCPVHGAVRALNEAMQETAQLRLALTDAIARIGNEELRTADAQTQRDAYIIHLQHKFTALLGELQTEESNVKYVAAQRDEARRDLAAATTALGRVRDLCDLYEQYARDQERHRDEAEARGQHAQAEWHEGYSVASDEVVGDLRAVLPAAGDGPATTGGETDGQ